MFSPHDRCCIEKQIDSSLIINSYRSATEVKGERPLSQSFIMLFCASQYNLIICVRACVCARAHVANLFPSRMRKKRVKQTNHKTRKRKSTYLRRKWNLTTHHKEICLGEPPVTWTILRHPSQHIQLRHETSTRPAGEGQVVNRRHAKW